MTTPSQPYSGTYFVKEPHGEEELLRLTNRDQLVTASLGGVLVEQTDPQALRQVLDVACGVGGWAIDAARTYPEMWVVGIDSSSRVIATAQEQAVIQGVAERVQFRIMDALRTLDFADHTFDLVNVRFALGFMRTWEWPRLLGDLLRVLRPGGVIRLTDEHVLHESNSPALQQFNELLLSALFSSGRLPAEESTSLTGQLALLLNQQGFQQIKTQEYAWQYHAGTPQGQAYVQDRLASLRTLRPFIQQWGSQCPDYAALQQQAIAETSQPTFSATWHVLTAWGTKSRKLA